MLDGLNDYRRNETALLLAGDDDSLSEAERAMASALKRIRTARAGFDALVDSAEEAGYIGEFDKLLQAYLLASGKLDKLVRGHQASDASDLFSGDSDAAFAKAGKSLGRLAVYETKGSNDATQQADATYRLAVPVMIAAAAFAIVLCILAAVAAFMMIARPLRRMTGSVVALAGGDIDVDFRSGLSVRRADELGALARALVTLRDGVAERMRLEAAAAVERVAKDRRQAALSEHTQNFGLATAGVMKGLEASAVAMRSAASDMLDAVRRTRESAEVTAAGADASARNLNSVAAAVEQLSGSVNEISRQVRHATDAIAEAVGRSGATEAKVAELAGAADRIGDVLQLISNIAAQTNLLALNATIEAARAGDAGRGFAVVAGEVKSLAAQTAQATGEIEQQINSIRGATQAVVVAIREVGMHIGDVKDVANTIAIAVEQQTLATGEIAGSIHTVMQTTNAASTAMQEVSGIAVTADAASRRVVETAEGVTGTATALQTEVNDFLSAVSSMRDDRRGFERIDGRGCAARLRFANGEEVDTIVANISRSGVALACSVDAVPGSEVLVSLGGGAGPAHGRVVRAEQGIVAITFLQDAANTAEVEKSMNSIEALPRS